MAATRILQPIFSAHRTKCQLPINPILPSTNKANAKPYKHTEKLASEVERCSMNAELISLCRHGRLDDALKVLDVTAQEGFWVFSGTYVILLEACANAKSLIQGNKVHTHMLLNGSDLNHSLAAKLIYMYVKCGSLRHARQVFDEMPERVLFVWNALIGVLFREGYCGEVLSLFAKMPVEGFEADARILTSVLPACTRFGDVQQGKKVHAYAIKIGLASNVFVANCLVDMYAKCDSIEYARQVFDKMCQRNVVSWNALITGYAKKGYGDEALKLFHMMKLRGTEPNVISCTAVIAAFLQCGDGDKALYFFHQMQLAREKSNAITIASVIRACASLAAVQHGKEIHAYTIKKGLVSALIVSNLLIDMYVKCGSLRDAGAVFDRMRERDIASWNTVISGYSKSGHCQDAIKFFHKMQATGINPNAITWNALITGFSQTGHCHEALKYFYQMQLAGVKSDTVAWSSLIAGCVQNNHGKEALKLLSQVKQSSIKPDLALWTSVIAAYAQNGQCNEALKSFHEMQLSGTKPDSISISNVLPACARLAVLQQGKEVHDHIIRNGFESDISVGNALIDMYAKCGSIDDARQVFDKMSRTDVVSWNTMIAGYAIHGHGEDAIVLFSQMKHSGIEPDVITFTAVLSACCHAGLVDKGWKFFHLMQRDYHITPNLQHYACMVDLLGRTGHLCEAHNFIKKMPLEPHAGVWGSLLAACRIYCNVSLGEDVAHHLFDLEPENAGNYVLLSNIYAAAGRWNDVAKVQRLMEDRRIMKAPGYSRIEVKNKMHVFFAGDKSYPKNRSNLCNVAKFD